MKEDKMEVRYDPTGYLKVTIDGRVVSIGFMSMDPPTKEQQLSGAMCIFSQNQIKTFIAKTENLIETYDTGDCPSMLGLLLSKIKEWGLNDKSFLKVDIWKKGTNKMTSMPDYQIEISEGDRYKVSGAISALVEISDALKELRKEK